MKIFTQLCIAILFLLPSWVHAQEYAINMSFSRDTALYIFTGSETLGSLTLNADITLNSDQSLLRVVLVDQSGSEKLIFENYMKLASSNSFSVKNVGDETEVLSNVKPAYVKVKVTGATITIRSFVLGVPKYIEESSAIASYHATTKIAKTRQKIDQLNSYIAKTGQKWVAGETSVSNLSYEDKKRLFGENYNLNGLDYYIGGIFESNKASSITSVTVATSSYPDHFDWRERHRANNPDSPYYDGDPDGSGWFTSVKDQGQVPNCYAFATAGLVEAMANLYYNRHIDLDLSENDITSCGYLSVPGMRPCGSGTISYGNYAFHCMQYIKMVGVQDEVSYPNPPLGTKVCPSSCQKSANPYDVVKIADYYNYTLAHDEEELKGFLIKSPLVVSIRNVFGELHVVVLLGYHTIKVDDTIQVPDGYGGFNTIIVTPEDVNYIGKTYWIYKNSWGTNPLSFNGYYYILHNISDFVIGDMSRVVPPVTSQKYNDLTVRCVDLDGDGYYNWGIGPKPTTCPVCSSNEEDGDDSNYNLGPMDSYGFCRQLTEPLAYPATTITSNTAWSAPTSLCGDLVIGSGATLTITNTVSMPMYSTIIVQDGAKLIVDGGIITCGKIVVRYTSHLTITNNGILQVYNYESISLDLGSTLDYNYGDILNLNYKKP